MKPIFGTLFDIKPLILGLSVVLTLQSTAFTGEKLNWSEPKDDLQIALKMLPPARKGGDVQTRIYLRNHGKTPMTLLHPDTLLRTGAGESSAYRRALELKVEADAASAGVFADFGTHQVGPREAIVLQPGESLHVDRGEPHGLVALMEDGPGRVKLLRQEVARGTRLSAEYVCPLAGYLEVPFWQGRIESPLTGGKSKARVDDASPLALELRALTQPHQLKQGLRMQLKLTNTGDHTLYARLAPAQEGQPLWSLTDNGVQVGAAPAAAPDFPQPVHQVVLEPGETRTWTFRPDQWLPLAPLRQHELKFQAQVHWQHARHWHVASALSMLAPGQLRTQPVEFIRQVYLPEISASAP